MLWKDIKLKVEQIYNDYGKLVFSIAYNKFNNKHLAEEVTQETMKRLLEYPDKMKTLESEELKNYVAYVAKNIDKRIIIKKDKENEVIDYDTELSGDLSQLYDDGDFCFNNLCYANLKDEIRKLDPKLRSALCLYTLYGYTEKEASYLLGIPVRTLKHRVMVAKNQLREVFKEGEQDDE